VFVVFLANKQMRMAVRSVAKHFPTAIVSGRCRDKVRTHQSKPCIGIDPPLYCRPGLHR